ncbi:MAG: NUDIX hydrolase [Candidatus Paceibacterota bacterium]|jgi:8-oxo-dGTP pyrophosphatase MutT (NUDIX family)
MEKKKVFQGGIAIIYRKNGSDLEFLVVENSKTKNISFVSGAKEELDNSEIDSIIREIKEELDFDIERSKLEPTETKHDFIFGSKKENRAGCRGLYQVFLVDASDISSSITHTEELRNIKWLKRNEVLETLSFPDLKSVFSEATKNLK